ncbi:MAG: isoaspartyl peptidase/L-asparaginase [Planctomycetes bacterium]|nr:isoaspartyl peptidase/L-asparaginase [Planctomycetota bacterium]
MVGHVVAPPTPRRPAPAAARGAAAVRRLRRRPHAEGRGAAGDLDLAVRQVRQRHRDRQPARGRRAPRRGRTGHPRDRTPQQRRLGRPRRPPQRRRLPAARRLHHGRPRHRAGSVAGVEGIVHPITLARKVMEETRHVMLVGEGARWFALEQGLATVDVSDLPAKKEAWTTREQDPAPGERGHDTIALLVLDENGDVSGGCSTSGAGGKLPGRVGDSPILGSGLYVDDQVGAAGATGIGENVMRYCATFWIVELMRQGMHPQQACEEVIHRIAKLDPRGYKLDICFVALDKQGRYGAAASNQRFPFAVATKDGSQVLHVEQVTPR